MQQYNYYLSVKNLLCTKFPDKLPKAFVWSYGCQQNVSDGEKIKGMLEKMGYSLTDKKDEADFILFNTCAVREHAQDRIFGNTGALKNLKAKKPDLFIALCGCMMEQDHVIKKIKTSFPFVNLVFGTQSLSNFPKLVFEAMSSQKRLFEYGFDIKALNENLPIHRDSNFKAWLPIMYGCDNFCSYCVVPYVRGRERSRSFENVLNEAESLVRAGYKDITILGQNVNSYGKNLDEDVNFASLLRALDAIPGDYVLRFMTSHPKDLTNEVIDVIANSTHISTHLHLPFQSGSNRILKLMNRKYDREKYLKIVDYAKARIPNLALTSDVIVGFPGETEEDFLQTLSLVNQVGYSSLFTFIYSKREKTPAALMPDPITHEQKVNRFNRLLSLQKDISEKFCQNMIGLDLRILIEDEAREKNLMIGRTKNNILVEIPKCLKTEIGEFCDVRITSSKSWVLQGEVL